MYSKAPFVAPFVAPIAYQIHHSTSADSSRARLGQVVNLKQQPHARCQPNPLPIGQAKQLAVVQHRVKILHPECVHGTVQDKPLPVVGDFVPVALGCFLRRILKEFMFFGQAAIGWIMGFSGQRLGGSWGGQLKENIWFF